MALGGCSTDESTVEGPVTVYVSLPLSGPAGAEGRDAADGARLALAQADGRAGDLEVKAEYLDDASEGRRWDAAAVGRNARQAAQDSSTAAYIGELDSQPTRTSLPITNNAGIAQISPGAGGADLTAPAEGYPESPERYRPSGEATFARVVPGDPVVLAAAAERAADNGLGPVAVDLGDSPFGQASADAFRLEAEKVGLQTTNSGAASTLVAEEAGYRLDGPEPTLFEAPLAVRYLPSKEFIAAFRDEFGRGPGPLAAYGYEAMTVALDAIESAEGANEFRPAVVDGVLASDHPDSVLGRFSITDEGDTTLCEVQPYRLGGERVPLEPVCPSG